MDIFLQTLQQINGETDLIDFCRKHVLHGTPAVFAGKEDSYYDFRKRIAEKFDVGFHEIFITGSAKLGFSPYKRKPFDYDSDIDIAIVSRELFDRIMSLIQQYQMNLRTARRAVSVKEIGMYHEFLEYTAIGWIRPDKLPFSFQVNELKGEWFDFFKSISFGNSEVGNYKVSAGVFKTYSYLEKYTHSGLIQLKKSLDIEVNK